MNDSRINELLRCADFFSSWYASSPGQSISVNNIFALRACVTGFLTILEVTFSTEMQAKFPGVYIIPKQISQDVVESYFSRVRSMAGDGGHMTEHTYAYLCETMMAKMSN